MSAGNLTQLQNRKKNVARSRCTKCCGNEVHKLFRCLAYFLSKINCLKDDFWSLISRGLEPSEKVGRYISLVHIEIFSYALTLWNVSIYFDTLVVIDGGKYTQTWHLETAIIEYRESIQLYCKCSGIYKLRSFFFQVCCTRRGYSGKWRLTNKCS